jgi:hypothetical protein
MGEDIKININGRAWSGLIWIGIGKRGGMLWKQQYSNEPSGFICAEVINLLRNDQLVKKTLLHAITTPKLYYASYLEFF